MIINNEPTEFEIIEEGPYKLYKRKPVDEFSEFKIEMKKEFDEAIIEDLKKHEQK